MNALGKYCHNFPKLAKESGYCFELHRGRVDWTQIERLNIDDIVNNRNFQLLEQNLINVINCNLEREYDVKILDQNFVKLFQLAQLGVDYLSYCELYLDRCVILLQEQLASYEEDLELLRKENVKKSNQLKESKQKIKAETFYQCKRCEKVFLTEIYLKSHEKRRHSSNQDTLKVHETPKPELVNEFQQTDEEKKLRTTSTQTITEPESTKSAAITVTKENEEIIILKKEQELKIKNLENELEVLKERLKTAEKKFNSKNEATDLNQAQHQYPFPPNPMFYPQVIPFISPYVTQPQCINPDFLQQNFNLQNSKKPEEPKSTVEKQLQVDEEACPQIITTESPKIIKKDIFEKKLTVLEKPTRPKIIKSKKRLQFNKENLDPRLESSDEDIKPIPFPRKSKEIFENIDSLTNVTPFLEDEPEVKVTPVLKTSVKDEKIISSDNDREIKSKSFLKKMIPKSSPKIQELSKNLKRSLTNLYDSVSSSGKDTLKAKENDSDKEVKSDVVDGLNSRLKELGIDPEWTGIPKQTMKHKLKTLEHRRNLLSKENPTYPSIRKRLEKTIFKKINKNSNISEGKQTASVESLYENSPKSPVSSSVSPIMKEPEPNLKSKKEKEQETEPESVKNLSSNMYNMDFDSQSDVSNTEVPVKINKEYNIFSSSQNFPEKIKNDIQEIKIEGEKIKPSVKEMDFSIFQIGKAKGKFISEKEKLPKSTVLNTVDELQTDSDFDDDFLKEFEESSFKSINGFLNSTENDKKTENNQSNEKMESQSILKHSQSNQKPESKVKKKVFFADYPFTESQSSSTILNETKLKSDAKQSNKNDVWSSDSDWDQ